MMKSFYEITYRFFRAPWDIGPRKELVELVESVNGTNYCHEKTG